jgi:hypothetical protein
MNGGRLPGLLRPSMTIALAAALAGCLLVTGGADGYELAGTGNSGASCEAGASCSVLDSGCGPDTSCPVDAGATE